MPTKTSASHKSIKHSIVEKANSNSLIAVGIAVFIVIFCLFAARALFIQSLYLGKVINEKKEALSALEKNVETLEELQKTYDAFDDEPVNILTGNPDGDGPLDGRNTVLVLDSLPSVYDFPALSSSFEKILIDGGYNVDSIGGQEDASLAGLTAEGSPQPIEIPYTFSFTDSKDRTISLLNTLETSIRPMYVDELDINIGTGDSISTQVTLHTYFTAETTFEVDTREVEK